MKLKQFAVCLALALVILLIPLPGISQQLTLGLFDNALKPYRWSEQGVAKGADPDIVKEAARRAEIKIKIQLMPWKRILLSIKNGSLDGSIGGYKNKERLGYAIYTEVPLHYSYFSVFVLKGSGLTFSNIQDLYGKRVGKLSGYYFSDAFNQAVKKGSIYVDEVGKRQQLLTMLKQRRLDMVVDANSPMRIALKELNINTVIGLPNPVSEPKGSYLWFSKAANILPATVQGFNQALKEMQKEGVIEQIANNYGFNYQP